MIRDTIKTDVITALKAGEKEKASFLRILISEMQMIELILKRERKDLTDDDAIGVLKKEIKRRKEAIEIYATINETEKIAKEQREIKIINQYLPTQIGEDAIRAIVTRIVSENTSADFGTVMKLVMSETKGQADGKVVKDIVEASISKQGITQ